MTKLYTKYIRLWRQLLHLDLAVLTVPFGVVCAEQGRGGGPGSAAGRVQGAYSPS